MASLHQTTQNSVEEGHSHPSKKWKKWKLYGLRFAHSNAYVSIPILAITISTYMLVGYFTLDLNYVAFLFFSTLFLYPLHRLIGLRLTIPLEYSPAQKSVHKKPLTARFSVIIGFLGSIIFSTQLAPQVFQYLIPLGLISITYSLPLIPTLNGWKRLRDIPGIKIYAISIVVTLTTSTIPLLLTEQFGHLDIALFAAQRFLFILAITIPFDIRDVRIDTKWKLKTIPLLIGPEAALILSKSLLAMGVLTSIFQFFYTSGISIQALLAIFISHIWAAYILEKFKTYNAPLFNAFMVEGTMVFQFGIITFIQVLYSL